MNVWLAPELEKFVDDKVESGMYNNASEVVRESLRLLMEHEDFKARARVSIERGWLQAKAGQLVDGPKAMAEIREGLRSKPKKRA